MEAADTQPSLRDDLTRLAVAAAKDDLLAFILLMDPMFSVGPHHRLICDQLMRVEKGEIDRLMLFLPPRTSKSTIMSTYFPAWCLGRNPKWEWIGASHSDKLAVKFGRTVRDMVNSPQFATIFPGVRISKTNSAADMWAVTYHGRPGGVYLAAGTNQKIAGFGAHCAAIDDPISEQDAWSKAKRDSVNEWYPGGLRSRLMPGGRVVIAQTRWHEMDLSGFLLKMQNEDPDADQWTVISIPALNTKESIKELRPATLQLIRDGLLPEDYPLPKVGESFWPQASEDGEFCWPTSVLKRTKGNLPPYQWDALYMQAPSAQDGGIFKDSYWQDWDSDEPPECDYIIQSYDTAFSTRTTSDYSAYTTWGIFQDKDSHNENFNAILLGANRGHWAYPDLRKLAIEQYEKRKPDAVLVEKKASGQSLIQDLRLSGIPVFEFQPDRDKVSRAHAIASLFHVGKIYAPRDKKWAQEVINECRQFPNGANDDYVDTVTQAILWLRNGGWVHNPEDAWSMLMAEREERGGSRRAAYY